MKMTRLLALAAGLLCGASATSYALHIEAESYAAANVVATESTTDTGGGLDVGWIDPNDTIDYNITVPTAGTYRVDLRVASPSSGRSLQLVSGSSLLSTVNVPNTGGWQVWQTISTNVSLQAGAQTLRLTTSTGGWNINWFELTANPTAKIEAEDFIDQRGVATETTTDTGGGLNVGWLDPNDWINYTYAAPVSGNYQISLRLASTSANNNLQIRSGSTLLGTVTVPNTGGWQVWQTVTATIPLSAGTQTIQLTTTTGNWNLNWFSLSPIIQTAARIPITEAMVVNELGFRDDRGWFTNLFDEESSVTTGAPTNIPTTHWRVAGTDWFFPAGLIIDLGQPYDIANVYWFDGTPMVNNGYDIEVKGGGLAIETGAPFHWTPLFSNTFVNDGAWHNHPTSVRTRYIHILKSSTATYQWGYKDSQGVEHISGPYAADAPLMELVVYGTPVGEPPAPPVPTHHPLNIPMNQFIGGVDWWYGYTKINDFTAVGIVRSYHENWRTGSANLTDPLNFYNPYDRNYIWSNSSTQVYPAIQGNYHGGTAPSGGDQSANYKPIYGSGDPMAASTYIVHGDNMFQWAARYGHNTNIPESELRQMYQLHPIIGGGTVNYIEDWNEPDGWWFGRQGYFTPYEMAAMMSADYDGDQGRLGTTIGVKNADVSTKLAMGGLASFTPDYVKGIQLWANEFRGGSFPADVLNFHHYDQTPDKSQGASPESDNLLGILQNLVQYRNVYQPGKELWLSEFGWDVLPSEQQANAHALYPNSGYDATHLQAIWLIRAYLIGAKAGVDRMMVYTIHDSGINPGKYATSGLADYYGNKRQSWYFVSTLKDALTNMIYAGEQASGDSRVWIYKFKNVSGNNGAYVLWCPTSDGTTVSQYTLSLTGNPTAATSVVLTDASTAGTRSSTSITNHSVKVDVSEQPVFVLVDDIATTTP